MREYLLLTLSSQIPVIMQIIFCVEIIAMDSTGLSGTFYLTVTVLPVSHPPFFSPTEAVVNFDEEQVRLRLGWIYYTNKINHWACLYTIIIHLYRPTFMLYNYTSLQAYLYTIIIHLHRPSFNTIIIHLYNRSSFNTIIIHLYRPSFIL